MLCGVADPRVLSVCVCVHADVYQYVYTSLYVTTMNGLNNAEG